METPGLTLEQEVVFLRNTITTMQSLLRHKEAELYPESVTAEANARVRAVEYESPFVARINQMAKTDQNLLALTHRTSNLPDLLIRFAAFVRRGPKGMEKFSTDIDGFIASEMEYWQLQFRTLPTLAEIALDELIAKLARTFSLIRAMIGLQAFSKQNKPKGPMSRPLADVVVYEFATRDWAWLERHREAVRGQFTTLVVSTEFQKFLGSNTTSYSNVLSRFDIFHKLLNSIDGQPSVLPNALSDLEDAYDGVDLFASLQAAGDILGDLPEPDPEPVPEPAKETPATPEMIQLARGYLVMHRSQAVCERCRVEFTKQEAHEAEVYLVGDNVYVRHDEPTCRFYGWSPFHQEAA
jgi:hypothetical protein